MAIGSNFRSCLQASAMMTMIESPAVIFAMGGFDDIRLRGSEREKDQQAARMGVQSRSLPACDPRLRRRAHRSSVRRQVETESVPNQEKALHPGIDLPPVASVFLTLRKG